MANVVKRVVAAIGLGSNLDSAWGSREGTLWEAIRRCEALGQVAAVSSFRETDPVGFVDQPRFLNAAILLETRLGPGELIAALLRIESDMGRVRVVAKGPRTIDLDLLLYGEAMIVTDALTVPHPAMAQRQFVLEPLAEIAPEMMVPGTGCTVQQMLGRVAERTGKTASSGSRLEA